MAALLSHAAYAHMDRKLTLAPDGSIPEIPASLGKVVLKISGLDAGTPSVEFDVDSNKDILPTCLTRFIHTRLLSDVELTGSWYHNEDILPYYVTVRFREPRADPASISDDAFEILFNLHNARVLEMKRYVGNTIEKLKV